MGARINYVFKDSETGPMVVLYSHWGETEWQRDLAQALQHAKPRWDDSSYGTRMIISYLMADQEINIKLNGIAQIRSELKALKGELANATDPKQMADLAEKAGELSDKLKDANERAAVFASGSRFEQTSNAFGLMSSQLMSMDFEGASESAKLFAGNLGKIDGKTISSGLKGLGSTVASVGGAFLKLGAQLLVNPIFLLVAVIGAIVAGLYMLADRLGFVTKFVDFLTQAFKPLIDMIKWFLDLMGLTSFAADEALAKTTAALEEEKEKRQEVIGLMDQKIALLDAEGKSTDIGCHLLFDCEHRVLMRPGNRLRKQSCGLVLR